jgi:hypothetical protein
MIWGYPYFRNHINYQHLLARWSTNLRVAGRCRSLVSELERWLQTDTWSLWHRNHSKLDNTHIILVGSGWFLGILDISTDIPLNKPLEQWAFGLRWRQAMAVQ